MTRGQRYGGWPLAVASLSLAAGVLFGVQTVRVEHPPTEAPPTTQPRQTLTTDEFVAQAAAQIARRLRRDGVEITPQEVVELLTEDGEDGVVITQPERPPGDGGTVPTTSTTTTTTRPPTTTEPRRPPVITIDPSLIPDAGDILEQAHDDYSYPTTPTVP